MGIQSFLKAQKGDPDWAFTPEFYFEKEFKIIDANLIELSQGKNDQIMLRQEPTERGLLAKHLKIDIRENATLDLTVTNEAVDNLQQVFIYDIRIRENAMLNLGMFVKGGQLNKHIIQLILDEGANFNAYGYVINNSDGDCEIITKIDHRGSGSISNQYFSCESGHQGQTVFQSMVSVPEDADYVQVGIENNNLITGDAGQCFSMPEVFNQSSTAKTTSVSSTDFLDRDLLYYLQTRGMTQTNAECFLIRNHREQVLSIIQPEKIREEIDQLLIG